MTHTMEDVLVHLQLLGSGQESPYSNAEMIAVVGKEVEGRRAMQRSREAAEAQARNPIKHDLTEPRYMYMGMLNGELVTVYAYLQRYRVGSDSEYWLLCTASPKFGGRKLKNKKQEAEAEELKPKMTRLIEEAALAAGWEVIPHFNDRQILITRYYAPWSHAERPEPVKEA